MSADTLIGLVLGAVVAVSAVVALHARFRRGVPLGLGIRGRSGRDLLTGLAIGSAGMAVLVITIVACSASGFGHVRLDTARLGYAFAVLAAAAVGEEVVYRVLMLGGLARLTRRPGVALFGSAVLFGLVHLTGSPDATVISVLSNALGGVMYGVAFLRTGKLWMPVGIHFAWNLLQGTLFGFPISDETGYSGALLHPVVHGSRWLTGGAYGPEGSVLSLVARLAIIAAVLLCTRDAAAMAAAPGGRPATRTVETHGR